ncbi:RNA polymerase II C-terminal domain phosphatase-like 3 isoform X2 [Juglans microcarpa x Juglans regia]|uniref:RNA polymerase II C-terminal domain phosphatase-like 3 isoform X2 n=1 Tax=Juglans microcarpa x Juglans regia TaxID=2249226 RepID=UPI001B7E6982|nr:RNA polymerase II C-terminal domain phosphatase-like 3 isoform X2 [Juglans microcarpa x Juglans regia]
MVVAGSNCFKWNNSEGIEETLGEMGKDETKVEDVEEGEISDTASVEEITEEDFKKQESITATNTVSSKPKAGTRVWTVQDLYQYQVSRGYASSLYNLAWAQAVQNKPLNEIFVMEAEVDPDEKSKQSSALPNSNSKGIDEMLIDDDNGDDVDVKVVDVDKEEGELEEGEIDLDSEPVDKGAETDVVKDEAVLCNEIVNVENSEIVSDKRMTSILEALESVTVIEAEKSFGEVCSRMHKTLESLKKVFSENHVPLKDALVQLSFTAIQAVNSVFCSMNNDQKEQNKDNLLRLISYVKNFNPPLFSSEQMKEIEVMKPSVDSVDPLLSSTDSVKHYEMTAIDETNNKDSNASAKSDALELTSSNKLSSDSVAAGSLVHSNPNILSEVLRPGISSFKSRGALLPLLDLHKDHDADSLPSPTREAPSRFPVHKVMTVGEGMANPLLPTAKVAHDTEDPKLRIYETDALKAFSNYQQKFGRNSFFTSDRLPSPTPSEECDDGNGDIGGEVSSSSSSGNLRNVNPPILGQPVTPSMNSSSMQGLITTKNATTASSGSNIISKALAKSRDPRLRLANSDVSALDLNQRPLSLVHNTPKVEPVGTISSRKQKTVEEPTLEGHALKRQRIGLENSGVVKDVENVSCSGGWLDNTGTVGPQLMNRNQFMEKAEVDPRKMAEVVSCSSSSCANANETISRNDNVSVTGTSTTASLPALLKDIAVNPTMLLNILKMGGQQRLAVDALQNSADPAKITTLPACSTSILGAAPLGNVAPSKASGLLQKPTGTLQVPSLVDPMEDTGKIRMKPRDPRRILHGNSLHKHPSSGHEHIKIIVPPTSSTQGSKDNLNAQKQEGEADAKSVHSQSVAPPDIARQFTKNLKNIADIISVSQASTTPIISQNMSSETVQVKSDKVDVKVVASNSEEQQSSTSTALEVGVAIASRSENMWGDVEHLFEGYDDQQKAAIQRERARRIEEQKKMFAAHKLCLVLDLDHTLLNSAKFVEVDPVHDEILRKKEEQDREKPQRHLFRFPHMGMWTKLRPGIWTFLEKASKLFELHLYTMGNKLYATEMAKVLDPKGVLFAGRVISRGDDGDLIDGDERVPKSKDLEGVLGMESAVVIIDDSVRVWPHNKLNLIVVERYTYFPCSRRQFGLLGPSLLEIDHDERPEEGTLASSLGVIERIHQNFFSHHSLDEVDVRNILAAEQRKILAGCRIVFSRVFPVGEANPHLHPLWQTAEQFGAVCTNQIDEQVTHVVANSLGTDKVNWALSTGRFVVYPGWVEASALLYRRANERDFAIKPQTISSISPVG